MSHCTKFQFQYTNRKIICRTFKSLGLDWWDDVVMSYANIAFKSLGIFGTDKTPAIIAEKNGFHYFMCKNGEHYELEMEKHGMSQNDEIIAKSMAKEYQQAYIGEVAKEVVQKMNERGGSALLEQNESGYLIKFGSLYDKSILVKYSNGRVIEEVHGVKGQKCVSLTEALENMLSSQDVELKSEWTEEYYEKEEDGLSVYTMENL